MKNIHKIKKPLAFCLSAALGCLIFALLFAEPFLFLTSPSCDIPSQSFCLTIDVSGSMAGDKMDEVKRAAKQFVEHRAISEDTIALVIFSSVSKIVVPPTNDADKLYQAIDELLPYGGTNFEDALRKTKNVLPVNKQYSAVILFTDGTPTEGDSQVAADIAYDLRGKGSQVICVTTEDGDEDFLQCIAGDKELVINAADGEIEVAFREAEAKITAPSVTGGSGNPFIQSAGWSLFLCLGIAFFLVVVQNKFLRKPLLSRRQFRVILIGSLIAGPAAGILGEVSNQLIQRWYSAPDISEIFEEETVSAVSDFVALGQMIGWTLLGAALAFGMSLFIPNLSRWKSSFFGAWGGFLGSVAFIFVSPGSFGGRLLGAFILGACIGLVVSIVELAFTKAWLLAIYDLKNITRVNLGREEVTVGSAHTNTIVIPNAQSKAGVFRVISEKVHFEGVGVNRYLKPGERVKVGSAELLVCSKDSVFEAVKFYPMRKTRISQEPK